MNACRSSHPRRAASTGRNRWCQRLTDVASAAAGPLWVVRGGRPQREVVGEGRQRSHVHHIISQQPIASTQLAIDLR